MKALGKLLKRLFGAARRLRRKIAELVEKIAMLVRRRRESEEMAEKLRRLIRDNPDDLRISDWKKNLENLENHIEELGKRIAALEDELNRLRRALADLLS